jgi:hypothetical protein
MNGGRTLVSESVLDYVTAVIFAGFFAEQFFVVSILVSTRGLFRKCCPTQRAADGWESARFWGFGPGLGWIPFFNPLPPTCG